MQFDDRKQQPDQGEEPQRQPDGAAPTHENFNLDAERPKQVDPAGGNINLSAAQLTGNELLTPEERLILCVRQLDSFNPDFLRNVQNSMDALSALEIEASHEASSDRPFEPLQLIADPDELMAFTSELLDKLNRTQADSMSGDSLLNQAIDEILQDRKLDSCDNLEETFQLIISAVQSSPEYQELLREYKNPSGKDISELAALVFDIHPLEREATFAIPLDATEVTRLIDSGTREIHELASGNSRQSGDQMPAYTFGKFSGDNKINAIQGINLSVTVDPPYCYLEIDLVKLQAQVFSGSLERNQGALQFLTIDDDSAVLLRETLPANCLTLKVISPDEVFQIETEVGLGINGTPEELKEQQITLVSALIASGIPYEMTSFE